MVDVAKIAVTGIIGVILAVELKEQKSSVGMYVTLAVAMLLAMLLVGKFGVILDMFSQIEQLLPVPKTYLRALLKIMGITYVADLAAGICKDAGHGAVAQQIQMFGKVSIFAVSMPLLMALIETIGELL